MKAREVTAEDLEYGLKILARILYTQGDAVWPLFERLERELKDVRSRRERVERHLNISCFVSKKTGIATILKSSSSP